MQISDMRALRTIFTQKGLFLTPKHRAFPYPARISFQNSLSARHFHPTNRHYCSQESNQLNPPRERESRPVWTVYNPLSGRLTTQRVAKTSDGEELDKSSETQTEMGLPNYGGEVDHFPSERKYGSVNRANSVTPSRDSLGRKKGKGKSFWVCTRCGHTEGQWWGMCPSCNASSSMKRFYDGDSGSGNKASGETLVQSWLPQTAGELQPLRLSDVNRGLNKLNRRIPLPGIFGNEVSRVLGGGLVPGSLILIGGDPGVGKSTLLLQIAAMIAEEGENGKPAPVLYVSGEESVEQIGERADRLDIATEDLFLYSSTDVEDILAKVVLPSTRALVVDSIQTVYLSGVPGSPGGIPQVKECTAAFLRFAKRTNIPVLLIGHVTKTGDIAGPRVLEHIVDVVLYLEGEKSSASRLLRSVKNRFGSTDELGVLEMSQFGLKAVQNPSEMFLSEQYLDSDFLAGVAVAVVMDGTRAFLIEIQALCVSGSVPFSSKHVNGIPNSRAQMIISVLLKQAGLHLQESAVFLNVVSGVTLTETAGDLAIAAAICSSFLEFPLPNNIAFIGEIGLGGELRMVPRIEKRVQTVAKLGYKMCVVPKSAVESLQMTGFGELKIIGCRNLKDVINTIFRTR